MPVVNIPIAQGFYTSESLPLSAQECTNLYPSFPETSTITDANLFGTPGIELLDDAGATNTNRGAHVFNGIPYFVNGEKLWRLNLTFDALNNEVWELVEIGDIAGDKRVSMSNNGVQMMIVVPELDIQFNAFIVDTSDVITQVSDPAFLGPASDLVFVNGFFILLQKAGQKFFKSALRNGLVYNALDFANAEEDPDKNVGLAVYRNQLLVLGTSTLQGFQNVGARGTADFPFISSGVVEQKGLISPATLTEVEGYLFWLGSTARERPQILIYDGGRPTAISTRAIERRLRDFSQSELEQSFGWDYSEDGSDFVAFTFPKTTFVFDLSTKLWHERKSINAEGQDTAYRISNIVEAYSFLIAADILNGNIGRLSKEIYTEYGGTIKRRVVMPPIDNRGERTEVSRFEMVAETGVGLLPSQQGDSPQIRLSFSDDGGRSFVNMSPRTLGGRGQYSHRVYWNGLGSFQRSRMFAIDISDPVKITLIKAEVDLNA